MIHVDGKNSLNKLIEILGLQGQHVRGITVNIEVNNIVTATITKDLSIEDVESVVDYLSEVRPEIIYNAEQVEKTEPSEFIWCRFDYCPIRSNRNANRTFAKYELPQAPEVGELFNVDGNPFIVIERGWAIGDENRLCCYLDVIKAGDFDLGELDIDPMTKRPYREGRN